MAIDYHYSLYERCCELGATWIFVCSNWYILAARDMSGNSLVLVLDGPPGSSAVEFIGGDLPPRLENFNLNIETGNLTLIFNEIVDT